MFKDHYKILELEDKIERDQQTIYEDITPKEKILKEK